VFVECVERVYLSSLKGGEAWSTNECTEEQYRRKQSADGVCCCAAYVCVQARIRRMCRANAATNRCILQGILQTQSTTAEQISIHTQQMRSLRTHLDACTPSHTQTHTCTITHNVHTHTSIHTHTRHAHPGHRSCPPACPLRLSPPQESHGRMGSRCSFHGYPARASGAAPVRMP
jgi:hypothetical protein